MVSAPARLHSAELEGIDARIIEVEVDLHAGLHAFNIVGLADKALSEARERVNSALKNTGAKPPNRENRKITVNLAPGDVKKTGTQYDLAIALGYLLVTKQIQEFDTHTMVLVGELSLDGRLRPVSGALNIAQRAQATGFRYLIVPYESAEEAAVVENLSVIPARTLQELINHLEGQTVIEPMRRATTPTHKGSTIDFSEIKGQENAKRALMIAAAGGHNLLMTGPPGVGKSMLAQALIGILPTLRTEEAVEITKIYSAAGLSAGQLITARPFRSPHHTASLVAVVGGGPQPKPGEISLAHRGVLFLDELPEFQKNVIESLRQPLESGMVHIARAKKTLTFPAQFTLIAAMNPCPCGFYGDEEKECRCAAHEVLRYQKKISGPLLDRIDLQIKVPRVSVAKLRATPAAREESAHLNARVASARDRQAKRLACLTITTNAEMGSKQVEQRVHLEPRASSFLDTLTTKHLSPRGYYRLLKTAQTIADLEECDTVSSDHLAEAFSYRMREETS